MSLTLTSRAGPVEILKSVDLAVSPGESIAIVGPSGSGKTSLLMVIAGLERATSGQVQVAGHEFMALDEDELALIRGANIGIVFQSFHLVPTMTALENVALPLEFAGKADAFDIARALLDEVGLVAPHRSFSGPALGRRAAARGARPRARALARRSCWPTSRPAISTARPASTSSTCCSTCSSRRQATLILVTHDTSLAERCGRVVRMADGRIERELAPA